MSTFLSKEWEGGLIFEDSGVVRLLAIPTG